MRLNKFIAVAIGISRRQADDLIASGKITVNDTVAILGTRVEEDDIVKNEGIIIEKGEYEYVMMHKPEGYVSSRKAQGDIPTIYELLPDEMKHLKTVGRLDKDSSGLMILSNDGDFTHTMTHPSHQKEKVYYVETESKLSSDAVQSINKGVQLEDGISKLGVEEQGSGYEVRMSEGRNRQIRRTIAAVGGEITKLHRLQVGDYSLDDLKEGQFKKLEAPQ